MFVLSVFKALSHFKIRISQVYAVYMTLNKIIHKENISSPNNKAINKQTIEQKVGSVGFVCIHTLFFTNDDTILSEHDFKSI